jgi:hypothetical protein
MKPFIIIVIIVIITTANGLLSCGSGTAIRRTTEITHHQSNHPETKHSTQNYTNNKGHTTHNTTQLQLINITTNAITINKRIRILYTKQ